MDDIRAQLDALMGADRNVPLDERDKYRKERKFTDEDVCKAYLCGFCPHEEFRRTKNDCGDCPCIHDEGCKRQWDELDDRSKERYGYEADLLKWFDRLLIDLRKRIDANTVRLAGNEAAPLPVEDVQRLDNMAQQVNDLLARAATLGEQGEVDAAQAAAADAERLKAQRSIYEQQAQSRANARVGKNLNQQVCQISGLIINNEESRLVDHHAGRNFNSWKKLHEVHAVLLENARRRRSGGPGHYRSSSYRDDARRTDYRSDGRRDRDRERSDGRRERDRLLLEEEEGRAGGGSSRRSRDERPREERGERGERRRSRSRDRGERRRSRERGDSRRERRRSRSRERRRSPKLADARDSNAEFVVEYVNPAAKPLPPLAPAPTPRMPAPAPAPAPMAGPLPAGKEALPAGPQLPNVPPQY